MIEQVHKQVFIRKLTPTRIIARMVGDLIELYVEPSDEYGGFEGIPTQVLVLNYSCWDDMDRFVRKHQPVNKEAQDDSQ